MVVHGHRCCSHGRAPFVVTYAVQYYNLISELKMAHFGAFWLLFFSAQLRLLLYLQKIGHYWTAKTSTLSTVTGRAPRKTADMYIIRFGHGTGRPYWLPGGKQIYIKTKFNLHSKQKYSSSFKISPHISRGRSPP